MSTRAMYGGSNKLKMVKPMEGSMTLLQVCTFCKTAITGTIVVNDDTAVIVMKIKMKPLHCTRSMGIRTYLYVLCYVNFVRWIMP